MRRSLGVSTLLLTFLVTTPLRAQSAEEARVLRMPDIGGDHIAFVHANDIWIADRDGGEARRLTTFEGAETHPHFSPDGTRIAFSGEYDGNVDVYVVSVDGGRPQRLTYHPGADLVEGWTPDGRVLFSSGRVNAPRPWPRLWTIGVDDPMPEDLGLARAATGSLSPDGRFVAYQLVAPWETEFRNYRGGQAQPIRVADLSDLDTRKIPWEGSNDIQPVWIGSTIFFLSDRDFAHNVWAYDVQTEELTQRTHFTEFDCKQLDGDDRSLVFENGGYLYVMDASGGDARQLHITLRGDFSWARPHWEDVSDLIRNATISPSGKRALVEARGEIFTVPAENGDIRNLSQNSGAADRAPSWSPDGKTIAYFTDRSGEYQLVLTDQFGANQRTVDLDDPDFYYTPAWSPDSKYLAYTDAGRNLWLMDVEKGRARRIDDEGFATPQRTIHPMWSPDSKWIAYSRRLKNQFDAVFVYSLESKKSTQLTDGMSDAFKPAFDRSGKYLYFLASTDYGMNVGWLDMSSYNRPLNYSVYVAVLDADEPSPLAPQSDDEEISADTEKDDADSKGDADESDESETQVTIDFDGIGQRILALDLPARPYADLRTGKDGQIFFTEQVPHAPGAKLHRYDLSEREDNEAASSVGGYAVSADGEKLLLIDVGGGLSIVDAGATAAPGDGALDLGDLRMKVDPSAEWHQIFREAWRFQRDFFYVKNVHGLDMDWAYQAYGAWVDHIHHRNDLTYVLDILGGETSVGHSFTGGGDEPDVERVPVGLLGIDVERDGEFYRIAKIYDGENWNPDLRAPLSGPGLDARVGDRILSVDGRDLRTDQNFYAAFDRCADRQIRLELQTESNDPRELTVVPVANDTALRSRAWVEDNRRRVSEASDGKLAYVWVPDTGEGGYTYFTRYFFAQQDRKGAIIDERFNHGGSIADYMVDLMSRKLLGYFNNPVGDRQSWTAPNAALWGPKVMLVNEMSGSGGDMLPYMFRKMGIGQLVGTRTWGGLVGIWDVPELIDGGFMTAPRGGFYDTDGKWAVENEGVAPDVEVEQDPAEMARGIDPQLEAAIAIALEKLETEAIELLPPPADPVRVRRPKR